MAGGLGSPWTKSSPAPGDLPYPGGKAGELLQGVSPVPYRHCRYRGPAMKGKISRWGNSLAVRIPKSVAEELGISENGNVEIRVADGSILVEPVAKNDIPSLEELVAGITEENRHAETDWGAPAGREVW